jgi:hypothetical protein
VSSLHDDGAGHAVRPQERLEVIGSEPGPERRDVA